VRCELRRQQVQASAKIQGDIIGGLASGKGPAVEGIAGSSALEAMEGMPLEVYGEAAAGSRSGSVQRARAVMLRTTAAPEAEAKELHQLGY
jgi:hypothetical protein